jgi:hypothetical protein
MTVNLSERIHRQALDFAWFIYEVSFLLFSVPTLEYRTEESIRILLPRLRYEFHSVIAYGKSLYLLNFPYNMVNADSSSTSLERLRIVLFSPDTYIDWWLLLLTAMNYYVRVHRWFVIRLQIFHAYHRRTVVFLEIQTYHICLQKLLYNCITFLWGMLPVWLIGFEF